MDTHDDDAVSCSDAWSAPVTIKLESCQSSWQFQPARKRFRRLLKGLGRPGASTGWRPYYGLRFVHADGFVVLLNPQGTRLLHSWRHHPGAKACDACTEHPTEELRVGDIRQLAG